MRRLALALALPLLAGCPTSPGVESTLVVHWSLRDINGGAATCALPGPAVTTVNVIVNGALVTAPCSAGQVRFDGLGAGVYNVTVEAVDADNRLQYRDWASTTVGQGVVAEVNTTPGRGSLRIAYGMNPPELNQCNLPETPASASGTMWFRLDDSVYGEWITIDETSSDANKQVYQCGDWGTEAVTPMVLRLPFGIYTLKWIREVKFPLDTAPPRVDLYRDCTPHTQEIHSAAFIDLPVTLDPVTPDTLDCAF